MKDILYAVFVNVLAILLFSVAYGVEEPFLSLPKQEVSFFWQNKQYTLAVDIKDDADMISSAFCYDHKVGLNECNSIKEALKKKQNELLRQFGDGSNAGSTRNFYGIPEDLRKFPINLDQTRLVNLDLFGPKRDNFYYLVQDFCEEHGIELIQCDRLFDVALKKRLEIQAQALYQRAASSLLGIHDSNSLNVRSVLGDLENNLKGLFDTFLVNYNLVHRALMAKAVPIATLLVEKRQQHNEILRYLFAQGSDKDNWPNANVFPALPKARNAYRILNSYSDRFKSLFRKARNGIADRHGRTRVGEGLRLPIERFDANNFSYAEYLRYAKSSTPVIITGLSSHVTHDNIIPGLPNWNIDRVNRLCNDRLFELKKMDLNSTDSWARIKLEKKVVAKQYLDIMEFGNITSVSQLHDLYLHDAALNKACPKLLKDVIVPKYFAEDLMQRIPGNLHWQWKNYRDYWPSIFIGGKDTSSALHADWANSAAWMGLISGKKRWRIVHPRDRHLLYEDPLKINVFPSDLFKPDDNKFPTVKHATVYEAILEPGEVIFIPSAAPHQVLNIGETVSIAMNFIDIAALDSFREYVFKNRIGGSLSHYIWLDSVLNAFDKLDLSNEYQMLNAAMEGDDLLLDTMNIPSHKRMTEYKYP